jgi:hypothetical protein
MEAEERTMKYLIGLAAAAFMMALTAGAAQAQGTWNAIAIDKAGGYNLVTGADSEDEAKQQAIDACGDANCEAIMSTESLCLSIADTTEGNYQYGWSYGNTLEGVEHIALGYCYESGYAGCKTLVAQCIVAGQSTAPTDSSGPKTKSKG